MARWGRVTHHADLRCPSDAGSQPTSIRYGERLTEIGAVPSIGSVGDSFDCETPANPRGRPRGSGTPWRARLRATGSTR